MREVKELVHDPSLYRLSYIGFNAITYELNKRLDCRVEFDNELYVIQNKEFDITVWGESRQEAEYSFAFTFHSLYQNFAIEKDAKLSVEARKLKQNLLRIVKKVIDEGQKS